MSSLTTKIGKGRKMKFGGGLTTGYIVCTSSDSKVKVPFIFENSQIGSSQTPITNYNQLKLTLTLDTLYIQKTAYHFVLVINGCSTFDQVLNDVTVTLGCGTLKSRVSSLET